MNTIRREELKSRWRGCLEMPREERHSYLKELSDRDPEMAAELGSLLTAEEASGDFLEQGFAPALPKRLGVWQPIRELGRGGMGQVFHAVRAVDGFEQQAALKTLRADLAGPEQARRFQRERQILARLDHPNIARLLDGGEGDEGRPYLAMEFIEGQSIDAWAEGKSRDEKLGLFAQACRAVEYAHRHLVVHCDLKPSNILVNAEGQVKLLDFGIARLLTPESEAATAQHLTPQYASPEQLRNQPLSTGSDIYSLGVVLYKMLTGRLPYAATETRTTDPVELARQICEAKALSLGADWPPDLEAIAAKALRKDPGERYATAGALAKDIQNFRQGRSVEARPLSRTLEIWRALKRHKAVAVFGAAALIALLLTMGWALQERARAQRMLVQTRQMSGSLVWEVERALRLESPTEARRLLLESTSKYLNDLASEENLDRSLAIELGDSYRLLGNSMGEKKDGSAQAAYDKGLAVMRPWAGDARVRFTTARLLVDSGQRASIDQALGIYESLEKDPASPARWMWAQGYATAQERLGVDLARVGDYAGTERVWLKGLGYARESQSLRPDAAADTLVARMERRMGAISSQLKKPEEAARHYRASSEIEERAYRASPGSGNAANLATSLSETAYALRNLGKPEEATPLIDRSVQLRRKLFEGDSANEYLRFALSNILALKGENMSATGQREEAGAVFLEAEAIAGGLKDGGLQKAQIGMAIANWEKTRPGGLARAKAKAAESLRTVETLKAAGKLPAFKQSLYEGLKQLAQ